jgi:Phosphorylase superfamily
MPNRANVWALKKLGVRRIVAPIVCGALRLDYELGDMVACDQFIDRTWGREDTYYQGPGTVLVGSARPFCEELSSVLVHTARDLGQRVHVGGTAVIVHGPLLDDGRVELLPRHGLGHSHGHVSECHFARELDSATRTSRSSRTTTSESKARERSPARRSRVS